MVSEITALYGGFGAAQGEEAVGAWGGAWGGWQLRKQNSAPLAAPLAADAENNIGEGAGG